MTIENFYYRTNPLFLRNQFDENSFGKWKMPIIPKCTLLQDDYDNLRVIGFDKIKSDDGKHSNRIVHFFLYDYNFEKVWKSPEVQNNYLSKYKAVLTPDFSMYIELNPAMQLYNTFRNRWCGAYFANNGLQVIPTVNWGDENTFEFCFDGIEKGSVVAVSTYMVSEHNNHSDQKEFFLKGYREMLRIIEPERILCYNTPFPEMEGNIVTIDYELSSWMHMEDDLPVEQMSKYSEYICGAKTLPADCDIIIKSNGYILKGSGSAYGGEWQPKKEQDKRFLGEPGEIKQTSMPNGNIYETKIGEDGRAIKERHHTIHNPNGKHSNPHDHLINWDKGFPDLGRPINYFNESIPEFKHLKGGSIMKSYHNIESFDPYESISDFKWSVLDGKEVGFKYCGKEYFICYAPPEYERLAIYGPNKDYEYEFDTLDQLLNHEIEGEKLRNFIVGCEITCRNL